jgi:hypothetical protein
MFCILGIMQIISTPFIPSSFAGFDGVLSNTGYGILDIPSVLSRGHVESIHNYNESSGIQ